MMNVLWFKAGPHIYIKAIYHKSKNLLTLQMSEGYLEKLINEPVCRNTYSGINSSI